MSDSSNLQPLVPESKFNDQFNSETGREIIVGPVCFLDSFDDDDDAPSIDSISVDNCELSHLAAEDMKQTEVIIESERTTISSQRLVMSSREETINLIDLDSPRQQLPIALPSPRLDRIMTVLQLNEIALQSRLQDILREQNRCVSDRKQALRHAVKERIFERIARTRAGREDNYSGNESIMDVTNSYSI